MTIEDTQKNCIAVMQLNISRLISDKQALDLLYLLIQELKV